MRAVRVKFLRGALGAGCFWNVHGAVFEVSSGRMSQRILTSSPAILIAQRGAHDLTQVVRFVNGNESVCSGRVFRSRFCRKRFGFRAPRAVRSGE